MSDLQEIITNTSIKAFNTGLWRGQELERERIIEILKTLPSQFARKEELERAIAVAIKRIEVDDE